MRVWGHKPDDASWLSLPLPNTGCLWLQKQPPAGNLSPSESLEAFTPPAPFGLEEMDPAGVIPKRPYTKDELQTYLEHGREKCRKRIADMTDEKAHQHFQVGGRRIDVTAAELLLYVMRHVQHHAAQLNLILRQETDSAPGWIFKAKTDL